MVSMSHLSPGGNMPLRGTRASAAVTATGLPIDVSAVLLTGAGKVRGDSDLVFFNHPVQDGVTVEGSVVTADLARLPQAVQTVASVDADRPGAAFDGSSGLSVRISAGGEDIAFTPTPMRGGESVVVMAEFYRRGNEWKVRAVGQGYADGLAGLATDFGIVVDDPGPAAAPATAISLEKMQRTAPGLVDLYKTARVSLEKKGMAGQRAAVYLVMDHSWSMKSFYKNGTMQQLAEQVLGLSANLDDDGTVPLVFFSSGVDLVDDVSLTNYHGRIEALSQRLDWGGTAYAPAMRAVIDHYRSCGATDPAFVVFQTDGEPADRKQTRQLLQETSTLPIFWQFVGFGGGELRFLRGLDTLKGRAVDNAGFFAAGSKPQARSDADLYDDLMNEFPDWLGIARAAGILR